MTNGARPTDQQRLPWEDSDGDGMKDNVDACPTVPGPLSNLGWPE